MALWGHQHYAAQHAHTAKAQSVTARIAGLLLEEWKSIGGSTDYDPTALDLGFSSLMPEVSQAPLDGNGIIHGMYIITVEGILVLVGLNYEDVAHDSSA